MSFVARGYGLSLAPDYSWSGKARLSSREILSGDLFAALPGQHHDGHKFIGDALTRGAAIILCLAGTAERLRAGDLPFPVGASLADSARTLQPEDLWHGAWLVEVENVEHALQDLAYERRLGYRGTVIGITGSFGKTTTKEILRQLLPGSQATVGNLNNHLGVPISLLNFETSAPQWICEMGMNHPGELTRLGTIAQPDIVLFTPLGRAHIGESSGEWIAEAKTELLRTPVPPRAVWFPQISQGYAAHIGAYAGAVSWYGVGRSASATVGWDIGAVQEEFPHSATLGLMHGTQHLRASWDVPFADYAGSVLAGLMLREALGLPVANVEIALRAQMGNRMRIAEPMPKYWVINDAYNASPETMLAAAQWCGRRLDEGYAVTALLADMFELGEHALALHREVLEQWQASGVNWRLAARASDFERAAQALGYTTEPTVSDLPGLHELVRFAAPRTQGQILFAKGSHGSGLGDQLDAVLQQNAGAARL